MLKQVSLILSKVRQETMHTVTLSYREYTVMRVTLFNFLMEKGLQKLCSFCILNDQRRKGLWMHSIFLDKLIEKVFLPKKMTSKLLLGSENQ